MRHRLIKFIYDKIYIIFVSCIKLSNLSLREYIYMKGVDALFYRSNKVDWGRRLEESWGSWLASELRSTKQKPPWGTRWDLLRYLSQWWFREGNLSVEFDRVSSSNLVNLPWWGKTDPSYRVHPGVLPYVLNEYLLNIFLVCWAPIIQELCAIRRFD